MKLATVLLAAGLGTRMKSARAKVLHAVAGRPMITYPVELARKIGSERVVCVLGHQHETVRAAIAGDVEVALQLEQRGTGHALLQAAPLLDGWDGLLLVLYGDTPLLTAGMLERLVAQASERRLALVTTFPQPPKGYGRVVRGATGKVERIVEEKDCTDAQRLIGEVNAGLYCGPARYLLGALRDLTPNNAQGELYLTDVVERAARELDVATVAAPFDEVMGINDRVDLARADRVMRLRLADALMRDGVTVRDPETLVIEPGVTVGRDAELGRGVELRGRTTVGAGTRLDAGVVVTDSAIGERVHVKPYCVITESTVGDGAQVGPWAHLRPGSVLEADVHLGNFVETKKTRLGRGAKANHLSYLGDATIGAKVNVGCGTITCNYDGYKKYETVIEEGAFIGSDTQLVAPVRVGAGAVVAAGTTVVEDVPPGALALTRATTVHVAGYAERKRREMAGEPPSPSAKPKSKSKSKPEPSPKSKSKSKPKVAAKRSRPAKRFGK
jgi:bifunctional UDP-N-acetylglucosamine pyrophosphorylase / glucosamine-1-phosphate N-acetyltransferase